MCCVCEVYEKFIGVVIGVVLYVVKLIVSVIGKGVVWIWEIFVMKGVCKVVNVIGDVFDKVIKFICDIEVYKNVKNVIDDGSLLRYGGWVEKEE